MKRVTIFKDSDNNILKDNKQICNAFSDHFISKYSSQTLPNYKLIYDFDSDLNFLTEFTITKTDVLREILNLDINKSAKASEIPTVLIKKCNEIFTEILVLLFNLILKNNQIPEDLKTVLITNS